MKIRSQHLNYYTLSRIVNIVKPHWIGKKFISAFTNDVDEIIFQIATDTFPFLRVSNLPRFSYFLPLNNFNKRKQNSVELFTQIYGKEIENIYTVTQERIIIIKVENFELIFKFFGVHSNIILMQGSQVVEIFRKKIKKDMEFNLSEFIKIKHYDTSITIENIQKNFPAIDSILLEYLKENFEFPIKLEKFYAIENIIMEAPYFISEEWKFLLKVPKSIKANKYENLLDTLRLFVVKYYSESAFSSLYNKISKSLNEKIKFTEKKIKSIKKHLIKLKNLPNYKEWGDMILTYSYEIKPGSKEVELFNFYKNKMESIKLIPDKTASEIAEYYYKKSKQIQNKIVNSEKHSEELSKKLKYYSSKLAELSQIKDYKTLKRWYKENLSLFEEKSETFNTNFQEYEYLGYKILVGKSKISNEELLKIAKKDDLWFHVKDIPSSHVIVKRKGKEKIPDIVKEIAGSLAAYYSRAKNNELVLIQYTERKYLRKIKGEKGLVSVMKEETFLVSPNLWKKFIS